MNLDEKPFDKTIINNKEVDIYFGNSPHSTQDNNQYVKIGERIIDFDGHRLLHEITFTDYNYIKDSEISGDEIRKGGSCTIKINGVQVYEFFYRDVNKAMIRAAVLMPKIWEHTLRLWKEDEAIIGRKIYYREVPAIITSLVREQGCIIVEPEENYKFPAAPYEIEDNDYDENDPENQSVKVDIYDDNNIWWWRK